MLMPAGAPMPGQELAFKLPREAAAACTSRLAGLHPSVALPSRLFQHGDPSHQQTEDYLADLIYRDPASFLERWASTPHKQLSLVRLTAACAPISPSQRYGKHLTAEEVTSFVPLSHDYEVGFWVRSLQATHAATAVAATITTGQVSPAPRTCGMPAAEPHAVLMINNLAHKAIATSADLLLRCLRDMPPSCLVNTHA